jgi:multidrug efflux pump subunit AcrA (membrane-fusion protein)
MFVHLRIAEGVRQHALLVPQQGITHDPAGQAPALIVDKNDKVQLRSVVASRAIGDKWLVTQGLKAGDRVIVKGLQFIKPGDRVRVEEARLGQPTQHTAANAAAG